ncbi:hypothetical protein TREMEDRAFT_64470 [Tremella mesenterica DSM 1558]|uniref:uncharacterized protein n=1 Tax=Tremella mesenterica (strain ATCC 24925 / CBS 8224 / DSM 1558 / NBRC 9311 / NRRL Y-6157 / RJB 2259-6 / UBC 559-6) TaxID=578456 RepID=UPI0003F48E84|nr:uncharacterized protein TREMEDRAFT_64470 [Tremella mesenterica DSM 1558]EIW67224.1 hypothetical protein TREMEDRAFT_64470 [Tremella mesenterica DSM 1558]
MFSSEIPKAWILGYELLKMESCVVNPITGRNDVPGGNWISKPGFKMIPSIAQRSRFRSLSSCLRLARVELQDLWVMTPLSLINTTDSFGPHFEQVPIQKSNYPLKRDTITPRDQN